MTTPSPIRDVLSLEDDVPTPTLSADIDKNKVLISTHYAGIQYPDVSSESFLCCFYLFTI